MENLS